MVTPHPCRRPVLFRPPYGALNDGVRAFLASRGYTIVFWTGGCIDWWLHNPQQESPIVVNSMADAGGLVCMHDSSLETCQGIATLVNMLTIGEDVVANPQVSLANLNSAFSQLIHPCCLCESPGRPYSSVYHIPILFLLLAGSTCPCCQASTAAPVNRCIQCAAIQG